MSQQRTVLGLNAFHGDASAVVTVGNRLVTGVEEERFTRVKHWAGFPELAIRHCLEEVSDGSLDGVDAVAVGRQPRAYLGRKAWLALTHPRSLGRALARARNLKQVASLSELLDSRIAGRAPEVHPVEHHLAHLASAFYPSPWDEAMCLSVDGFGDFVSTMLAVGRGTRIEVLDRVTYPHSLGQFYTAMTQYLGFPKYGDEYKVMGLAAYGEPSFVDELSQVVPAQPDGTFRLDLSFFRHLSHGVDMTWEGGEPRLGAVFAPALEKLLGPARRPDEELAQKHMDLAASMQHVYEQRFFALVRALQKRTGLARLTLSGGCALNSLANGRLFENTDIQDVYIQSAAGDAGTALGAALWVQHNHFGAPRGFEMIHSYWGPESTGDDIRQALSEGIPGSNGKDGVHGEFVIETSPDDASLVAATADGIANGEVVGWYQGRSEWGPRALGNRSIVADPRREDMRDILNLKIKRRESFRPFAPSILEERTSDWFEESYPDPFMLKVYPIRPEKRSELPAVTHVDGSGRLQTVSPDTNRRYWELIKAFDARTGVPIILNTSFNENEPIVNTPAEALACFLRTKMDRIVLDRTTVRRTGAEGI